MRGPVVPVQAETNERIIALARYEAHEADLAGRTAALVAELEQVLRTARQLLVALERNTDRPAMTAPERSEGWAIRGGSETRPVVAWSAPRIQRATTAPHADSAPPVAQPYPCRLTAREVEVLRLIAAGRSNREMAELLCRSERTVERHIENIYRKIGAHSKADATAFAIRHHLA